MGGEEFVVRERQQTCMEWIQSLTLDVRRDDITASAGDTHT